VVLSDTLWRNRFGARADLVGHTIRLDDRDFLVVGIAPPKFTFPKAAELWTPIALEPDEAGSRRMETILSAGRLKPGRSIEQLSAELDGIARRLEERYPNTNRNRRFLVSDGHRFLIGEMNRQYLTMLFGSVLFVLLIACVNVANLLYLERLRTSRTFAANRHRSNGFEMYATSGSSTPSWAITFDE
jgi:putative ABC transport system permease protein